MIEELRTEVRSELEGTINDRVKVLAEQRIQGATDRVAHCNQELENAEADKAALVADYEVHFPTPVEETQEVSAEVTEEVQG